MSFDLCDECIAKTGPFRYPCGEDASHGLYCHGCHQAPKKTTPVEGQRVVCTNSARCGGATPVFPPEKYDEYTTGWQELRSEPYDPEFPIPPIWIHCPACACSTTALEDARCIAALDKAARYEEMLPPVFNTHAAKKLREDLDKAKDDMEGKVIEEARDAMDKQIAEGLGAFREPILHGLLKSFLEQDIYKRTAAEHRQRIRDIADAGFVPGYIFNPGLRVRNAFARKQPLPPDTAIMATINFFHDWPFGGVGWDANGSPAEEYP